MTRWLKTHWPELLIIAPFVAIFSFAAGIELYLGPKCKAAFGAPGMEVHAIISLPLRCGVQSVREIRPLPATTREGEG